MSQHPIVIALVGLPVGILMGLTSFTGAIIVPTLILLFGVAQARSQGTAVALTLSPLQLPALWNFHQNGNIDWRIMGLMVPGVVVGTFIGSWLANVLPPTVMRSIFGLMMVYVGAYLLMMLTTTNITKGMLMAVIVTGFAGAMMAVSRWGDKKAETRIDTNLTNRHESNPFSSS